MLDNAVYAQTYEEALAFMRSGQHQLISRVPLLELAERAKRVKDGLFDFDGTLHAGNVWHELHKLLPPHLQAEDDRLRAYFFGGALTRPTGRVNLLSPNWFFDHADPRNKDTMQGAYLALAISWYIQSGVTRGDFHAIVDRLGERPGARELMMLMRHRCICTYGLEPAPDHWLRRRGIVGHPIGTRLYFSGSGPDATITGFHPKVVTASTKQLVAQTYMEGGDTRPEELLVTGDTIVDISMMLPETFNVLVVPKTERDARVRQFRSAHLETLWEKITVINLCDSLMPLVSLIRTARGMDL